MNTASYTCQRKPDGCHRSALTAIGDFSWRFMPDAKEPSGLALMLPGADGQPVESYQPIVFGSHAGDAWGWDGNYDRPTLVPSILLKDHWHGFLTTGRLNSC